MKHLKTYEGFSQVNEDLRDSEKRMISKLPTVLLSFVAYKLFGIFQLLNLKWKELKESTKDSKFDSMFSSGSIVEMGDINKIKKSDLPDNTLKLGMFLRNWNIYQSDEKSKGGVISDSYPERPIVYISKEELKKGDKCLGYRLSDIEVYSNFDKIEKENRSAIASYPLIIMVAKFDKTEQLTEVKQIVEDICVDISDDYPVKIEAYLNSHGDYLSVKIESNDNIVFDDRFDSSVISVAERIKDYLSMEKFNFEYHIKYVINETLLYYGDKGKFKEIIPIAKKYAERYENEEDYNYTKYNKIIWSYRYNCLDINRLCSMNSSDKEFDILKKGISGDEIRTLLSDMDNCFTLFCNSEQRRSNNLEPKKWKPENISIKIVHIIFNPIK